MMGPYSYLANYMGLLISGSLASSTLKIFQTSKQMHNDTNLTCEHLGLMEIELDGQGVLNIWQIVQNSFCETKLF